MMSGGLLLVVLGDGLVLVDAEGFVEALGFGFGAVTVGFGAVVGAGVVTACDVASVGCGFGFFLCCG